MTGELVRQMATYLIGALILVGAFLIIVDINQADAQKTQAWLMVGLIAGYFFRDTAQNSATSSVERIAAAQPTMTASSGPPATVTSTPPTPLQPLTGDTP